MKIRLKTTQTTNEDEPSASERVKERQEENEN